VGARLNFIHAIYAENLYAASAWIVEQESVSSVQVGGKVQHPIQWTPGHLSKSLKIKSGKIKSGKIKSGKIKSLKSK